MSFMSKRRGLSIIAPLFLLVAIGSLAIAAVMITQSGGRSLGSIFESASNFQSANSGLEWVRHITSGYTTSDKAKWKSLDGASHEIAENGGARFTLGIDYVDSDNDPMTKDIVHIVSIGTTGDQQGANGRREASISVTVPVSSGSLSFSDHFDQSTPDSFDKRYQFGQGSAPHGDMTPYPTILPYPGGDVSNLFTHSSEAGGTPSVLRMGGAGEARLIINVQACLKWNASGLAGGCDYAQCQSVNGCEARTGLDISPDGSGFQNYFIKIRARLMSGDGFGIYFRSSYANQGDPDNIDFGTLTAYIWQYDKGLGYLPPCDRFTAITGNNGMGMLATRRVQGGSETCGADCAIYQGQAGPATYPFFCPENESNLPVLAGWRFTEPDWLISWRTIYIYVFQSGANVYVGRQGITGAGGENQPEHVGEIDLAQVGSLLKTGDIGLRTWNGSVVEIDYINVYSNDQDNNPALFSGG